MDSVTEWIIPCNPKAYDVIGAFEKFETLNWKQSVNIEIGDIIYIYVGRPYSAVLYKCIATDIDLPEVLIDDSEFEVDSSNYSNYGRYMELKKIAGYPKDLLKYNDLKNNGLNSVQGPSKVQEDLSSYISTISSDYSRVNQRSCFIVFQGRDHHKEQENGYIWARKVGKDGYSRFYWENVSKVKKGDIILTYVHGEISKYGIAQSDAYDARRFGKEDSDESIDQGWKVNVDYIPLNRPIMIEEIFDDIKSFLPEKFSPFSTSGSANQGYLYGFPDEGLVIVSKASKTPEIIHINEIINEALIESEELTGSEKEALIKARIGQSMFKQRLVDKYHSCVLCGIDFEPLLVASHIKPWSESNGKEKVDVNNGLLLCPHHDQLFDTGYISFDEEGQIMISCLLPAHTRVLMNINSDQRIKIENEMRSYIRWHRENIFRS